LKPNYRDALQCANRANALKSFEPDALTRA